MRFFLLVIALSCGSKPGYSQENQMYDHLPTGKFSVGFRIFTLIDDSRVDKPAINYLGNKNPGELRRQITVHLWYPCVPATSSNHLQYADYCYNEWQKSSEDTLSNTFKSGRLALSRRSVENWFGKTTDTHWEQLVHSRMLALPQAPPLKGKWPLLIGMLRPLSTAITNEVLASNGFIVAMIHSNVEGSFSQTALTNIQDMRYLISWLQKSGEVNDEIGTFGFSGSGFSQVLFAMSDYRVKALADIESGIYMDELFQALALSNYYNPAKLRVPFLHIFSLDLSKQEKYFSEFEDKTIFSRRYRLLLNQPRLHHWDFATEGFTASIFLENRGPEKDNIRKSFEIACTYLLYYFQAEVNKDSKSTEILKNRTMIENFPAALWDIRYYEKLMPSPDRDELEYIIREKGIDSALVIVNKSIGRDSTVNLREWYVLNSLGYKFLGETNYAAAIGIFRLNTELHPDDANLFDSLAEAYETSGDQENMKKISNHVLSLLAAKKTLTNNEKGLQANAEKRLGNH